jgi:hypothetical protein
MLLVLTGCKFTLPQVTSATVEPYQSSGALVPSKLNGNQLKKLTEWFSQHDSGWSSSVASYVPILVVRANHSDGDVSVINVLSDSVVVNNRSGQYTRQFSQSDLVIMRSILSVQ